MSVRIQKRAIELLWKQWTAVGVAGNLKPPQQAIDLEALIAFTPYVAALDPRLADESFDWCMRIGKSFISISRLRQINRQMPVRSADAATLDLPSILTAKVDTSDRRLSKKSRPPVLELPCLVQLRSRYIFGVGARADILSRLATRDRISGAQRAATIGPTGYTKQAVATVLEELSQAGVLKKMVRTKRVTYEVTKDSALRSLLAPLPKRMPSWTERFIIVATILNTFNRFGKRATYGIELAKALDQIRSTIAAADEQAPIIGRPDELGMRIERWAIALLDDNVWETSWIFDGQDITYEILEALNDRLVKTVHSGDYPVSHIELGNHGFRNIDSKGGVAEFTVQFTSEHPKDEFAFYRRVEGTLRFDPKAEDKADLLQSLVIEDAREHFDIGDPKD